MTSSKPPSPYAAVGVAGQMGCLMAIMIVGALVVGVWIDRTFNTNRLSILVCVLGSIPITLTVTMLVTYRVVSRMFPTQPGASPHKTQGFQSNDSSKE